MELIFRIESIQSENAATDNKLVDGDSIEGFCHEPDLKEVFTFSPLGGLIGRSTECDWVLKDPLRRLSGKHASIAFEDHQYFITDLSTNGVFVNGQKTPLGKGSRHTVVSGDQFLMGIYRLSVKVSETTSTLQHHFHDSDIVQNHRQSSVASLVDHEHLIAESAEGLSDALIFPKIDRHQSAVGGRQHEDNSVLPSKTHDDFDQQAVVGSLDEPNDGVHDHGFDDWDEFSHPSELNSIVSKAPGETLSVADKDPVRLFMRGAGLDEQLLSTTNVSHLMGSLGSLLRCYTEELMGLLSDRSHYKNRCRLDMTLVASAHNNPLKYCVNDTQALREMVISPQPENLSGTHAIKSAVNDIREHFECVERGYQGTLTSLIEYLDVGQAVASNGRHYHPNGISSQSENTEPDSERKPSSGLWQYRKLLKQQQQKQALLRDKAFYNNVFFPPRFSYFYQQHQSESLAPLASHSDNEA